MLNFRAFCIAPSLPTLQPLPPHAPCKGRAIKCDPTPSAGIVSLSRAHLYLASSSYKNYLKVKQITWSQSMWRGAAERPSRRDLGQYVARAEPCTEPGGGRSCLWKHGAELERSAAFDEGEVDLEEEMRVRTAERGRADAEESSAMVPVGRGR